jgi:folate-binding protein YgfZ
LWGVAGVDFSGAAVWDRFTAGGAEVVRLPDAVVQGQAVTRGLWMGVEPSGQPALDADTWLGLEAASGVARVVAATAEQFVPQMVNLELVGGVNFQKGCYPGQEIVARSLNTCYCSYPLGLMLIILISLVPDICRKSDNRHHLKCNTGIFHITI